MYEYNDAVAHAYTVSDNNVGGSPACAAAIREGHRQLEVLLKSAEGVAAAEKSLGFGQGELATLRDQQEQLGQGAAYFPSQGNDPACTEAACNIRKICIMMLNASAGDELHRIAAVRRAQGAQRQLQVAEDWPDFWEYQTCTEFGFYQTCMNGSKCMWPHIIDVEFMASGCAEYDIMVPAITANIEATNKHYGGLAPADSSGALGSCVLWPNGEVDPWATLSVLVAPGPEQPVLWVDGASHHAWTHPSDASDQASVVLARKSIRQTVESFLAQACTESRLRQEQIVV
jgi:hypothetical protein